MRYKFHHPVFLGNTSYKGSADESEKISDSRKRCYPIRESESDSSNYKNMGTRKKAYI